MVSCPDERTILEFVEGRIRAEDKPQIHAHLDGCQACQAAVAVLAQGYETNVEGLQHTAVLVPGEEPHMPADAPELQGECDVERRYEIIELIGQGGMGLVYEAQDRVLDRRVALKLLRPDLGRHEGQTSARARMLREAQALARLNHPNVVTVHDAGLLRSGSVFVAMELVSGTTLRRWLETPRDWRTIIRTFVAAGRGLQAAHAKGIVHRDFKLDNVLIDTEEHVLVTDFGLARAYGSEPEDAEAFTSAEIKALEISGLEALSLTQTGMVLGTPAYMAPEQHRGAAIDPRADQFAFCVALYEALFGTRPFEGATAKALAANVVAGRILSPERRPGGVPVRVFEILRRGMASVPDDRFPSMEILLERLERLTAPTRWDRWLVAGSVVATAGILGWTTFARESPCQRLDGPVRQVWNDEAKRTLAAAFSNVGRAGLDTWARVEAELDGWSGDWVDARVDACEATRVRGEQSERLLDLRMRCLDDRLHELATYLSILGETDEVVVTNAVRSLHTMESVRTCSDSEFLEHEGLVPERPDLVEEVEALRGELTRIRAASATGRYEEALVWAEQAAQRAEATLFDPVIAEAKLELGKLLSTMGKPDRSEAVLDEGLSRALAAGHDRIMANAATTMFVVVAQQPERDREAGRMASLADAALHRVGDPFPLRGRWLYGQGLRAKEAARWDEAETHLQALLALYRNGEGKPAHDLALALNELGDLRRRRGAHAEALVFFEEALEVRREALGPHHPDVARDLNNLALALEGMGRMDEALARLQEALTALKTGYPGDHPDVARIHNNLGMTLSAAGRLDEAAEHLNEALRIKREQLGENSPGLGSTLANLGVIEERRGRFEEATTLLERSRKAFSSGLGQDHPLMARIQANLARLWLARGDPQRAREELEAALRTNAGGDLGELDGRAVARAQVELLLAEGQADQAVTLARRLQDAVRLDEVTKSDEVNVNALLGRALVAAGRLDEAAPLLDSAVRTMFDDPSKDTSVLVRTLQALSLTRDDACAVRIRIAPILATAKMIESTERAHIEEAVTACSASRRSR